MTLSNKWMLIYITSATEFQISLHFICDQRVFELLAILGQVHQMTPNDMEQHYKGLRFPIYKSYKSQPSPQFQSFCTTACNFVHFEISALNDPISKLPHPDSTSTLKSKIPICFSLFSPRPTFFELQVIFRHAH